MNPINNIPSSATGSGSQYTSAAQVSRQNAELPEASAAGSVNVVSAATAETVETEKAAGTDYSPAYAVEISKEGSQLNANAQGTGQTDSQQPKGAPPAGGQKPAGTTAGTTGSTQSDTEDSESDTSNLSQYSDYQLQQMVNDGKISQSQYLAEVARREAKQQTETATAPLADAVK